MYSLPVPKNTVQSKLKRGFVVFQSFQILKSVVPYEGTNEAVSIKDSVHIAY